MEWFSEEKEPTDSAEGFAARWTKFFCIGWADPSDATGLREEKNRRNRRNRRNSLSFEQLIDLAGQTRIGSFLRLTDYSEIQSFTAQWDTTGKWDRRLWQLLICSAVFEALLLVKCTLYLPYMQFLSPRKDYFFCTLCFIRFFFISETRIRLKEE
jgi:hypothetical protein